MPRDQLASFETGGSLGMIAKQTKADRVTPKEITGEGEERERQRGEGDLFIGLDFSGMKVGQATTSTPLVTHLVAP
jgi:hypothetical protein